MSLYCIRGRAGGVGSCKITLVSTRTLALCVTIALLAWGSPVLAHVAAETPAAAPPAAASVTVPVVDVTTVVAAAPTAAGPWTVLAAIVMAVTAVVRRRRAVALLFAVLLLVVAFEAGLHSVHHIGDHGAPGCVIASASAHAGALVVERVAFEQPARVSTALIGALDPAGPGRGPSPALGRAPPAV